MISKLKTHQSFRKYFVNTSWLFMEKLVRIVLGLFVGIWVARYLGPAKYGLLNYAQAFVGLFTPVATLGLNNIVIRDLVQNESKRDALLGTAFLVKLFGSIIVFFLLAIAVNFTSNDTFTNVLVFIIASATLFQSSNVIDFYFQSQVLSKYAVYSHFISLLFSSIIKIYFILIQASLIWFALVFAFENFILLLGFLYFYTKQKLSVLRWEFNLTLAKELIKDSWPLIFSGIVVSIYMRIDQIMIKEMLDNEAVGNYVAAVRISEAWYFIPTIISGSVFPAIINAKKMNDQFYYNRLQKLYDLMVWLAIAIALPMTFLSDWLVEVLYGQQYNMTGSALMIHIWAAVFVFLGVANSKWLISENLQKYSLINTSIGALTNIILNYCLLQVIGINGAAIATLISQGVASYVCLFFFRQTRMNFYNLTKSFNIIRIIQIIQRQI